MSRSSLRTHRTQLFSLIGSLGVVCFSLAQPGDAATFQGSFKLRWDEGREVNPTISANYPDNLTDRRYIEALLTGEVLFNRIPLGDRLRLGLRVLELQPSRVDDIVYGLEDERRIDDKIYTQWNAKKWEVWGGDVTETFGKGLALNLFEDRDLYFDSGLRGGKASYKGEHVRFKAIYGQSRTGYLVERENVGGVNLEYRLGSGWFAGSSLVHQEGIFYEKRFMPEIYGGFDVGPVTFYGEYAQRRPDDGEAIAGEGTYLSVDASTLGLAVHVGYKYYDFGVENPLQTPPIVQREFTTRLLSRKPHIPLMDDQVGFEMELSATPSDLVFLTLNFSRASKHNGSEVVPSLRQEYNPFWELFLESELYARSDLTLKLDAGMNEEASPAFWEKKTDVAAEAIYYLSDLLSITGNLESLWVDDKETTDKDHNDQLFALTLARAPYGSLNLSYEISSLDSEDSEIEGDRWLGAEISANVKRDHRLLLFYGRERGGLKCTSGVCRPVQPFEGLKLTYEGRF